MTISTKHLVDKVNLGTLNPNSPIADTLTAASAYNELKANNVYSVPTLADLPSPSQNIGRLVYVKSVCDYRYSNGMDWRKDFNSTCRAETLILTWGYAGNGELGDNAIVNKSSPVSVVGGFTDWCQVSAGTNHVVAIRTNGTAWAWGNNGQRRLGDSTTTNRSSPVSVVGGFTDWCQASAGMLHSIAVRTNGTAWAWGYNGSGQAGDSNPIYVVSSPVSVVGGFTDWRQVSAGGYHSTAVRTNGTLWTWGCNICGVLGDSTTANRSSPVSVVGGFTDWCQVSAGKCHTAAIRTNGTAWAWGMGWYGKLGDNTVVDKSSPVSVVGGFTDWCQIDAGYDHTAAIRTNGTLWAWGRNKYGRLGDDSIVDKSSPVSVIGGFTNWCQVSAGGQHTLAVRTDGTLWGWGDNCSGQVGSGPFFSASSPVSVIGGFTNWCQVSAGGYHSIAITKTLIGF